MYSVSDREKYMAQIVANDRNFSVRITFNSSTVLTGTTIQDITLDEVVNSTEVLTMGCACSNKITVNLIDVPTDIDYENSSFVAEVGLLIPDSPVSYTEWIPLGKFYVSDAETTNDFKNLKLTAYDGFYKMTGKYNANVSTETTLQAVYDDFKSQLYSNCGIVLKDRVCPSYAITFPFIDVTYQQAAAYIAGCFGEFARFDRNGKLEFAWYTDGGVEVDRSLQYMGGFKRTTEKQLVVTSVSTGTKDNPIVKGEGANGTSITFENPYITDTMASDIFTKVNNLTYTPCEVKWRGNPAVQSGDVVRVLDKTGYPHNVLVMSRTLKVGGGCNDSIICNGNSETKSEFSGNFESTKQQLKRVYSELEQSILNATNAITGNSGGYVVVHDTNGDGKPDEILIMDSENITLATKVWRWNKEGLGYAYNASGNAYLGPYRTAITADGQISADFITTGTLNAQLIRIGDEKFGDYIRLEDGVMHFGSADNPMSLRLGNITVNGEATQQVALYSGDKRIAYFSDNSFEIENLDDGKIRFQNFGFITRKTGNLSFTKLK
jgi:hypothetical protein